MKCLSSFLPSFLPSLPPSPPSLPPSSLPPSLPPSFSSFLIPSLFPSLLCFSSFFLFIFSLSVFIYILFCLFLKVIGDKKGGNTALLLDQLGDLSILEEIKQVVQVPLKFIHVHRNPFDNIATIMLCSTESREAVTEEGVRVRRI